jgi:DNA helicase-2/ATP-dependent DNA helicase PcrA
VYEKAIRQAGAIDFADMVPLLVKAMDRDGEYAAAVTGAYDHVLVDEYQDVNPGQVALIDRFVHAGVKLWAVGDDDQTLYAFRAADVRFILDFAKRYPGAQVHVLDRNYRSGTGIVAAAKRVIANNRARHPKDYAAVVADPGEIVIRGYADAETEARQAARAVAKLIKQGCAPQRIAVLYRTGSVGLAMQPAMQKLGIPYEVRGAGDLWQGVAARLVVGSLYYLRDGESVEAMSRMGSGKRSELTRDRLDRARAGRTLSFADACQLVRSEVGAALPAKASDRDRAEWQSVVDAVIALAVSCRSLEELEVKIAEQSATIRQAPENAVVLSTIHSAKGLEWDAVFMVGMEDGVLPHANNDDLEEERRVAYVGLTRAKRILGLSYANARFVDASRPSRFLYELTGREQRLCVWTGPRADNADDRLPLLSERERSRVKESPAPEPPAKGARNTQERMAKNRSDGRPARQGFPWSPDEDIRLHNLFVAGETIRALADAHQRSRGAIRSRLVKLGLIAEEEQTMSDSPAAR